MPAELAAELRIAWVLASEHVDDARLAIRLRDARVTHLVGRTNRDHEQLKSVADPAISVVKLSDLLAAQSTEFDLAVITGTTKGIDREVKRLAKLGKPVLLEAPPVDSPAEWQALKELSTAKDSLLKVTSPSRYFPAVQSIRSTLDAGKLGEVGLIRIHRWEPSPRAATTWSELLYADLDLATWLTGAAVQTVFALDNSAEIKPGRVPSAIQIHLGFTTGAMALIDVSRELPKGDDYYSLSVIGSRGAAYADDHRNVQLSYTGGTPRGWRVDADRLARLAQIQGFVRAVHESKQNNAMPDEISGALNLLAAIRESIATKRAVSLAAAPLAEVPA